jgi:hypothetical protein
VNCDGPDIRPSLEPALSLLQARPPVQSHLVQRVGTHIAPKKTRTR